MLVLNESTIVEVLFYDYSIIEKVEQKGFAMLIKSKKFVISFCVMFVICITGLFLCSFASYKRSKRYQFI